jgi:hypothetical protein
MSDDTDDQSDEDHPPERMTLREVFGSVMSAGFGVQSTRNRERDFARGSAKQFIIVGLIATVLFVGLIFTVVKIILAYAGA